MNNKTIRGFTLVELIVVITILAILWTIWFISLQWYSRDSRNTVRLTDASIIKKALTIHVATNSRYPDPDNLVNVTYSWVTLWKQWTFWKDAYRKLATLSNIPVDPLFDVEYNYWVMNNWTKFELWTIMEGWLFSYNDNSILNKTVALSNNDVVSYVSWDYTYKDIFISTWSTCYNITAPSLFINNIWANWVLSLTTDYKFVFNWSTNLPTTYSWVIDIIAAWPDFKISEVYNKCSVDNLTDLESYTTNLTSSYQQYNWINKFDDIIYNSNTINFQLSSAVKLKDDWLVISNDIIAELKSIIPDYEFVDSFTGSSSDSILTYNWSSTKWTSDYYVNNNELNRSAWTTEIIFPSPSPIINSPDTKISFIVNDISNGYIKIYAKYINSDNYYMLEINSLSYRIIQKKLWVESVISNIWQVINTWDKVEFSNFNNVLKFLLNDIEKDRVVADDLNWSWKPWFEILSAWDKIDDYKLYYR